MEKLGQRRNPELLPNAAAVKFDRLDTDAKLVRYLPGLLAGENQVEHFALPLGKHRELCCHEVRAPFLVQRTPALIVDASLITPPTAPRARVDNVARSLVLATAGYHPSASSPNCTISAARRIARALLLVSVHSDSGTESCTMPAPA